MKSQKPQKSQKFHLVDAICVTGLLLGIAAFVANVIVGLFIMFA